MTTLTVFGLWLLATCAMLHSMIVRRQMARLQKDFQESVTLCRRLADEATMGLKREDKLIEGLDFMMKRSRFLRDLCTMLEERMDEQERSFAQFGAVIELIRRETCNGHEKKEKKVCPDCFVAEGNEHKHDCKILTAKCSALDMCRLDWKHYCKAHKGEKNCAKNCRFCLA